MTWLKIMERQQSHDKKKQTFKNCHESSALTKWKWRANDCIHSTTSRSTCSQMTRHRPYNSGISGSRESRHPRILTIQNSGYEAVHQPATNNIATLRKSATNRPFQWSHLIFAALSIYTSRCYVMMGTRVCWCVCVCVRKLTQGARNLNFGKKEVLRK